MKEPHKQGLANQFGRESCAGSREGTGEALTAGNPGQPLSSENITLRVPTLSCQGEGHTRRSGSREFLFDATESETLCMDGHSHRGNRETSVVPCGDTSPMGRSEKAHGQPSGMYVTEESDDLVVPRKRANKAGTPAAEPVEESGSTKGNRFQITSSRTQRRTIGRVCLNLVRQVVRLPRTTVIPKVGAVCGSSARTDLCGGPSERTVPTATLLTDE